MNTQNLSTLKINKLTQAQYDRELAAGRIDPNALYLTPDESIQPDWNQNDETASDYIKNRPFYTVDTEDLILLENETEDFVFSEGYGCYVNDIAIGLYDKLEIGQNYTVIWDGITYNNLVCYNDNNYVTIGTATALGDRDFSAYPFSIYVTRSTETHDVIDIETNSSSASHTISIIKDAVVKIQEKYLPNTVVRTSQLYKPNLLVNGDFQVNQRGKTTYDSSNATSLTLDKWGVNALIVTVNDGYITIQNTTSESHSIFQTFDTLYGVHTVACKVANVPTGAKISVYEDDYIEVGMLNEGVNAFTFNVNSFNLIALHIPANSSIDIYYMDLFEGEFAYQHIKEDYGYALWRCQEYLVKLSNYMGGGNVIGDTIYSIVSLPRTMRGLPTITVETALTTIIDGVQTRNVTTITPSNITGNTLYLLLKHDSAYSDDYKGCYARINNGTIFVSNENNNLNNMGAL